MVTTSAISPRVSCDEYCVKLSTAARAPRAISTKFRRSAQHSRAGSGTNNEGKGDAVTGHTYFARCGDLIKIGHTTHLALRQRLFRRWAIELVAAFPGSRDDAWQLHQRFAAYRIGKRNGADPGRSQFFALPTPRTPRRANTFAKLTLLAGLRKDVSSRQNRWLVLCAQSAERRR